MMGLPGVGKTYVARRLAERIDAFHLLSDSIRKQLLGIPVGERRFEGVGKGIYKGNIGKKTYDEMMRRAQVFLSAGYSVIMDATFLHDDSRNRARAAAAKVGAPALFVFADCPERIVKSRLRRRAIEHSFSDANIDVYRAMKSRFLEPQASSFKLQARGLPEPGDQLGQRPFLFSPVSTVVAAHLRYRRPSGPFVIRTSDFAIPA
jgi:hypothetical protein